MDEGGRGRRQRIGEGKGGVGEGSVQRMFLRIVNEDLLASSPGC